MAVQSLLRENPGRASRIGLVRVDFAAPAAPAEKTAVARRRSSSLPCCQENFLDRESYYYCCCCRCSC